MVVSEVLTPLGQALLGLVIAIALATFGYVMKRISAIELRQDKSERQVEDLKSRVYGRSHDRTDPGGFLGEVKTEFRRVHRRLDTLHSRIDGMARTFNRQTRRGTIRRGKENSHDRRDPRIDGRNIPWLDDEFDDPDRPNGGSGESFDDEE